MKESNILEEIHLLYPTHMISMDILFKSTLLTSNFRDGIKFYFSANILFINLLVYLD